MVRVADGFTVDITGSKDTVIEAVELVEVFDTVFFVYVLELL